MNESKHERTRELVKREARQVEELRQTRLELAQLFEARANKLFAQNNDRCWVDVFEAITTWTQARMFQKAQSLIDLWMTIATGLYKSESMAKELERLRAWAVNQERQAHPC